MNAVPLIAVLVLVVGGDAAHNTSPCMKNPDNNAYDRFVSRHVLQEDFNTSLHDDWKTYLNKYKLCGRPLQSFVDKGDENLYVKICNGSGKRRGETNLCTSTSPVILYDLNVTGSKDDCTVTSLTKTRKYVTVACDKVNNRCLPVHFQDSQNNRPDDKRKTCKP